MKNLTTVILSLIAIFSPLSAFAHGTHVEKIDGHAHSLMSIATDSLMLAILAIAFIAVVMVWRNNRG